MVGTSGRVSILLFPNTATARSFPDCTSGTEGALVARSIDTRLAITSVSAAAMPLYGTCTRSMPCWLFSISLISCEVLPLPYEA